MRISDWSSDVCSSDLKAARRPHTRAGTYAKRFAAKEAFSTAVGTGFRAGVFMRDIGVVNAPSGAPTLKLTGGALVRLESLVPDGYRTLVQDRKSVVQGKSVSVRVDHGGRRRNKKKQM